MQPPYGTHRYMMHLHERCFRLTVVRHAQTTANCTKDIQGHLDTPLTELGTQQATCLGEHFKRHGWLFDRIYTSDLGRAVQTAKIIASTCGRVGKGELIKDSRLRERKFGPQHEGKPIEKLKQEASTFGFDDTNFTQYSPAGSETLQDVQRRVEKFCCETLWVECRHDEEVLIVTHWATLKEFLKIIQPKSNGAISREHLLESPNTAFCRFTVYCKQADVECCESAENSRPEQSLDRIHVECLHKTPHISSHQVTAVLRQRLE